jgi:hypothetical protein
VLLLNGFNGFVAFEKEGQIDDRIITSEARMEISLPWVISFLLNVQQYNPTPSGSFAPTNVHDEREERKGRHSLCYERICNDTNLWLL